MSGSAPELDGGERHHAEGGTCSMTANRYPTAPRGKAHLHREFPERGRMRGREGLQ